MLVFHDPNITSRAYNSRVWRISYRISTYMYIYVWNACMKFLYGPYGLCLGTLSGTDPRYNAISYSTMCTLWYCWANLMRRNDDNDERHRRRRGRWDTSEVKTSSRPARVPRVKPMSFYDPSRKFAKRENSLSFIHRPKNVKYWKRKRLTLATLVFFFTRLRWLYKMGVR